MTDVAASDARQRLAELRLERGRTLFDLSRLQRDLQELVGSPVDLVTEGGLSPYIRDRVLAEALPL